MDSMYKSVLVRNAFAVITDIFSEEVVKIALALTDLIELLFLGGFIICILIILLHQGVKAQMNQDEYIGNMIFLTLDKIFTKVYLFFYLITIRFFVVIINEQILVFTIYWFTLLSSSTIILSFLFIVIKD